jgi:hypothetical protein
VRAQIDQICMNDSVLCAKPIIVTAADYPLA